jgi:hypothetical protein
MKNRFKSTLKRGLASAAVALWLASLNGFALTNVTPTHPAASSASSIAPDTGMLGPPPEKSAPARMTNDTTEDIRDIRGPKPIPSPWFWPLCLAGGATLAALAYAAWLWNRRSALATALLPYELALARLAEARPLMQPESAREFSIAVSEIVRHYIEQRFQVWAARRTTEEFLHGLLEPSDALLTTHRALLADFLRHCDLAKFARWVLSAEEMETMLQSARSFVLTTGKLPAPTIPSAAAQAAAETAPALSEAVQTNP